MTSSFVYFASKRRNVISKLLNNSTFRDINLNHSAKNKAPKVNVLAELFYLLDAPSDLASNLLIRFLLIKFRRN